MILVAPLEWFYSQLLSDWNNWNFGTLETCTSLERFERSAAIKRLERLKPASRSTLNFELPQGFELSIPRRVEG